MPQSDAEKKLCKRCGRRWALTGQKHCSPCEDIVVKEMRESGYLTYVPQSRTFRGSGAKEHIKETKQGTDR